MNRLAADKLTEMGITVKTEQLLKNHTTFRVGGKCDMIVPKNASECSVTVKTLNELGEDIFVLGHGSNIIASDDGTQKAVVLIGKDMSEIKVDGNTVVCDAGASLMSVCRAALENDLSGLEFAYGIPGNVGGAVYMNAGAYGGEIKDVIVYADAVSRKDGTLKRFTAEEMELSYRHSAFMSDEYIIVSACFALKKDDHSEIEARMNDLMSRRKEKQPLEYPSAGSTFKRPEGSYASLLIDQCGLKGCSVGGAEVSTKHAGFVINKGNATANDIFGLIDLVSDTVKEKTGYVLECEPVVLE